MILIIIYNIINAYIIWELKYLTEQHSKRSKNFMAHINFERLMIEKNGARFVRQSSEERRRPKILIFFRVSLISVCDGAFTFQTSIQKKMSVKSGHSKVCIKLTCGVYCMWGTISFANWLSSQAMVRATARLIVLIPLSPAPTEPPGRPTLRGTRCFYRFIDICCDNSL